VSYSNYIRSKRWRWRWYWAFCGQGRDGYTKTENV